MVFGKDVEVQSSGKDRYGRTIGQITADGKDVNHEMVATGMAWHYEKYDRSADLRDAEKAARAARRGLWADKAPVPPWDWRAAGKKKAGSP